MKQEDYKNVPKRNLPAKIKQEDYGWGKNRGELSG